MPERVTPQSTKTILNSILKQMFLRADLIDMYSLADPERCKRYVVVAADALDKLFIKHMIYPERKEKGTIYFQSLDGFAKDLPADVRQEQNKNCLALAFFFIRIFQIYAALTISILDSELPTIDPVEQEPRAAGVKPVTRFIRPPGFEGFAPAGKPKSTGWLGFGGGWEPVQRGGELTRTRQVTFYIPDGNPYKILNTYLSVPSGGTEDGSPMKFTDDNALQIPQDTLYDNAPGDTRVAKANPEPRIIYTFKDVDTNRTVTARLEIVSSSDIQVKISDAKIGAQAARSPVFEGTLVPRYPGDKEPQSQNEEKLPQLIKSLLEKAIEEILGDRYSTVLFLKNVGLIRSTTDRFVPIEGTRISLENPSSFMRGSTVPFVYQDEAKIDGEKKTLKIRASLDIKRSVDPVSKERTYTVRILFDRLTTEPAELAEYLEVGQFKERKFKARSDTAQPLSDSNQTIPSFLQEKFDELLKKIKTEGLTRGGIQYTRAGLPKPYDSDRIDPRFKIKDLWTALAKDPPVKAHCIARAVQLLSVAGIKGAMGEGVYTSACRTRFAYVKDKSLPETGQPIIKSHGIKSLALLFIDKLLPDGTPKVADAPEVEEMIRKFKRFFERLPDEPSGDPAGGIDAIVDKSMEFCVGHWDEKIYMPGSVAGELRAKASSLIQRQMRHVDAAMRILFRLFDQKKAQEGSMALGPEVLRGGMEALDKLATDARNLLIAYYADCEKTYTEGLQILNSNKDSLRYGSADAPPPAEVSGPANTDPE